MGATWTKVSNAAMDALISGANNIEIAVGTSNNVYVAIVNAGQLAGVFRSPDSGATWAAMDLPATVEGGIHPGGQGSIHLSIAADPNNANIVYIGGDRQPGPFPSSIGAVDFSGRLFRGDASQPAGSQFVHLTHSSSMGAVGGGTISSSAPHADSRDMDVAANGVLIEGDDGGIYRRTNPQTNNGDWFSMNGDIQTTEFHAVAWDADADIVIGGAQDTGTPQQQTPSNVQWRSVSTADGGVVAVDDFSTPGFSTRYSSNQNLGGFRRRVYMGNVFQSQVFLVADPARRRGGPRAPILHADRAQHGCADPPRHWGRERRLRIVGSRHYGHRDPCDFSRHHHQGQCGRARSHRLWRRRQRGHALCRCRRANIRSDGGQPGAPRSFGYVSGHRKSWPASPSIPTILGPRTWWTPLMSIEQRMLAQAGPTSQAIYWP